MAEKVWVYPEKSHEELGAERWTATWRTLPEGFVESEDESPDPDILAAHHLHFRGEGARERALEAAHQHLAEDYYGCPTVQRQVVDWYVEEDRVAHWVDSGDPLYIEEEVSRG